MLAVVADESRVPIDAQVLSGIQSVSGVLASEAASLPETQQRLECEIDEQRRIFQASARRKDDELEANSGEITSYRAEFEALAAELRESRDYAVSAASQRKEAEAVGDQRMDEVRAVRKNAAERFQRHVENMEELSECLLDARSRCAEAQGLLSGARGEASTATAEAQREARQRIEACVEVQSQADARARADAAYASSEALVARSSATADTESQAVGTLRFELQRAHAKRLELEDSMSAILAKAKKDATSESEMVAKQIAVIQQESAIAIAVREELVEVGRHAQASCASERDEATKARALGAALHRVEEEVFESRHTEALLKCARKDAQTAKLHATACADELQSAERHAQAEAAVVASARLKATSAEDRARGFDQMRASALRRAATYEKEAQEAATKEAEARRLWIAERWRAEETQAEAVAAAIAAARLAVAVGEARAEAEAAFAGEEAAEAHARARATECEAAELRGQLGDVEESLACERAAAAAVREILAGELVHARRTAAEAAAGEERQSEELDAEVAACAAARKQVIVARERAQRLQEREVARLEEDEERMQELAMWQARAMRDARSSTELRGELADVRREAAKNRQASRDLERTAEELHATKVKLGRALAPRGREVQAPAHADARRLCGELASPSAPPLPRPPRPWDEGGACLTPTPRAVAQEAARGAASEAPAAGAGPSAPAAVRRPHFRGSGTASAPALRLPSLETEHADPGEPQAPWPPRSGFGSRAASPAMKAPSPPPLPVAPELRMGWAAAKSTASAAALQRGGEEQHLAVRSTSGGEGRLELGGEGRGEAL